MHHMNTPQKILMWLFYYFKNIHFVVSGLGCGMQISRCSYVSSVTAAPGLICPAAYVILVPQTKMEPKSPEL